MAGVHARAPRPRRPKLAAEGTGAGVARRAWARRTLRRAGQGRWPQQQQATAAVQAAAVSKVAAEEPATASQATSVRE